jgi:hypothetical protein
MSLNKNLILKGKGNKEMIDDGYLYKINKDGNLTCLTENEGIYFTYYKLHNFSYKKYLKRIKNRNKLYKKLKKLGR